MSGRHTQFYRDKEHGKIAGVAAGIADYTGIDTKIVRIAMVLLLILSSGWLAAAYIVAAITAPVKPRELYVPPDEQKFWQGVRAAPGRSAREVRSSYLALERRLVDLETHFTSRDRDLANEIESLR